MIKNYFIIFIASIFLTALAYLIDNDPMYADISQTLTEAALLSVIMFVFLSAIYFGISRLHRLSREQR